MKLARTALVVATAVLSAVAAQDQPPATPATTPPTDAAAATTSAPATTAPASPPPPTPTEATPPPPPPPAAATDATPSATLDAAQNLVKLNDQCVNAKLSATDGASFSVTCRSTATALAPFTTAPTNGTLQLVASDATAAISVEALELPGLSVLSLSSYSTTSRPVMDFTTRSFSGLAALTSLSFSNVNFSEPFVTLGIGAKVAYIKLEKTNAENVVLKLGNTTDLNKVDLIDNQFKELPRIFYQTAYPRTLEVNTLNLGSTITRLSPEEFTNAQRNLNSAALGIKFDVTCSSVALTDSITVCSDETLTGVRTTATDVSTGGSSDSGGSSTGFNGTATPTPSENKARESSSSQTTLTVVVIVIAIIAAVLAYFVARRYFCVAKSSSSSPRHDERLINKDDPHGPKVSFISGDETLRGIRLEQQEVLINKSVGTGMLWVGEYQGRKVMIKRVEAECNDSYATKALMTQARSIATLAHPRITSLIGVTWIQGTDFGVVSEFMEKGTLKTLLMDLDKELDLHSKLHICLDIAQALAYLHSSECNMYMKRLSSRKVLVNGAVECKLNLFECHPCTNKIEVPDKFGVGEMAWWAPELITRTGPLDARRINMFSLGVLICEIMTRASPYQSVVDDKGHTLADLDLSKRIRRQERLVPHENRREFTELPSVLRDMVERCLSYRPDERPTAAEMVTCLESVQDYSERVGSTTSL